MDKDDWEECKDLSCHEGVPFRSCVYPGIKFQDNKTWVICASSMSAYKIYHKIFDKYLKSEHAFYRDGGKYIEMYPNIDDIDNHISPIDNELFKHIEINTTRNLTGFPFGPGLTLE
jgi:hypothetical protein